MRGEGPGTTASSSPICSNSSKPLSGAPQKRLLTKTPSFAASQPITPLLSVPTWNRTWSGNCWHRLDKCQGWKWLWKPLRSYHHQSALGVRGWATGTGYIHIYIVMLRLCCGEPWIFIFGDYCTEILSSGILFLSWLQLVPSRHKHSAENGTQLVDQYN